MKNNTFTALFIASFVLLIASANSASAQAFRKGAFVFNVSEGWTGGTFQTSTGEGSKVIATGHESGDRDPFCIEYGIGKHWGIGLSSGTDFYYVDPEKYYGFGASLGKVKVGTQDFTLDFGYHFMTTAKTDFAVVASLGGSSASMKGTDEDISYQYMAHGNIARLALHSRLYFGHHFGFLAMASVFAMGNATKGVTDNNVGNGYTTTVCGGAFEFGLCYRIKK
jgi:hypothetical protein